MVAISKFTNTLGYRNEFKSQKFKYHYIGLPSDVEFAIWLIETLTGFVQKELKNYIWANNYTSLEPASKRRVINGFVIGCTNRISARLKELCEKEHSTNSNALVVIKNELIDLKKKELGLQLKQPKNRGSYLEPDAYGAGKAAGDRATFGRPVDGQGSVKMIGRG